MREEFEAWASSPAFGLRAGHFEKADDGEYLNYPTQCYFQVWQASRAAIVIELPQRWEFNAFGDPQKNDSGTELEHLEVVKAIEAAGLRVKS